MSWLTLLSRLTSVIEKVRIQCLYLKYLSSDTIGIGHISYRYDSNTALCSHKPLTLMAFHHEVSSPTHLLRLPSQPGPTNKQSIIHILGMLSSLFTTLDVNRQADSLERASSPRLTPSRSTQNPVSLAIKKRCQ